MLAKRRNDRVLAAQIRLLYENANTGFAVAAAAAPVLAWFQWDVIPHPRIIGWLIYMLLVPAARFVLTQRYMRACPDETRAWEWGKGFAAGAGMAGLGWGLAGLLLYPEGRLTNQILLIFVLGGMMLGAASLLAPRPESFLAFLAPTGVFPAIRLAADPHDGHLAMGLLGAVFTTATLITTWRFYLTIASSIGLKFENHDLIEDLQTAHDQTAALNQELELRVRQRTAELNDSNERLREEIRQRRHMEDELLRMRNLESLGVLAGGIAHDFNNFLTVIQGSIELAKMELNPGGPVREILDRTADACHRAVLLSSQLLTFAKGGAPVRRVVRVARLVNDAVQLARAGAAVSIAVDIAEDLWCAEADAGQIGQVLHNVLLNAKQAMLEGGIIEVRAENVMCGGIAYVRISIRDYGCGIAPDILPRIFDPYFTTKKTGSGLGLATTYAIVHRHGGRLSVESREGDGTTFFIELPASQSAPEPEPAAPARLRGGTGRLLVMEDDEALRKLLEHALGTLGYEVQSARDGAEAVALFETAKASARDFDAVLLDLTVSGGMGGLETAVKLREIEPSVKLIVSSGYSDAPVIPAFREYGFDDVLPKPWALSQLSEVFRRVLAATPQIKRK